MKQRTGQIIFQVLITISLFSFWAGFALLVVNKLFYKDLPGYTIGRICIWELIALIAAAFVAKLMIKKWGNLKIQYVDNDLKLTMNPKYGLYFSIYFLICVLIGIWQFCSVLTRSSFNPIILFVHPG